MKNKIKVNAIFGRDFGEIYGKYRVYHNTSEKLHKNVDFSKIFYEHEWKLNFPYISIAYKLFSYPKVIEKQTEKSDLIHIFSQEESYLLNRAKFNSPIVITCLDTIPLIFKDNNKLPLHSFFIKYSIMAMKNADKILTISNNTKKDLVRYTNIPPDNIETIYLGVDEHFKKLNSDQVHKIRKKYQLPSHFILYLGSEQPRKNFHRLIKAFYKLKKTGYFKGIKLLKVGRPQIENSKRKKIFDLINKLKLQKDVILIDYIPEGDLSGIYNAADLFVYPSLYEGFGLPPLESMACGTPVITSNTSSLPEVVGDAGLMVDPCEVDDLTKAMHEVLSNDSLRNELSYKGLKRAKIFNWNDTAKKTLKIYEEISEIKC